MAKRPTKRRAPAKPAATAKRRATARAATKAGGGALDARTRSGSDVPASSEVVRVGLVQSRAGEDPEQNVAKTLRLLEEACDRGARIVCTQELFRSTYFCREEDARYFALAEPIPGPTTKALEELAKRRGVVVVGSLFEKRAPGLHHNTAVVIDADGRLAGTYRKMHVPEDPRFYEKFYFAPGDLGFPAFDTAVGRVGVLVCWDQWYPEAARLSALAGARILFYPTAIGTWTGEADLEPMQRDAWRTVQRGHAIANGVHLVAPNRVGQEGDLVFWGSSFVAGPFGQLLAEGSRDREEAIVVDCDLAESARTREGWPFLRDRRIDAYGGILRRFLDAPAGASAGGGVPASGDGARG
jgi:N-carbamoylputrescine amidase